MLLCIAAVATTAAPHGYVPTSQPEAFDLRRVPVAAQGLMQLRANAFVVAFAQNIGCSLAQHAGRLGRVCARFSKVPSSLGRQSKFSTFFSVVASSSVFGIFGTREMVSVFAFSSARWHPEVDPFPQHTMLFFYADANATESSLVEMWPQRYGARPEKASAADSAPQARQLAWRSTGPRHNSRRGSGRRRTRSWPR